MQTSEETAGAHDEPRPHDQGVRVREERFRLIALATDDALYDWDMRTDLTWRNDAYQRLFSPDEPVGKGKGWWEEHLHPEDRGRVLASVGMAFKDGSKLWTGHYRFRRFTGEYANVVDRGYILRDAEGTPIRMVGAIADVTERERLSAELKESVRRLEGAALELERKNRLLEAEVEERASAERALRALSTPIIEVWDRVLALPLIGVMDGARARQITERLLQEVTASRAQVAILDLTGMEAADAAAASHLLQIARSVRLLGSRCVLSGISTHIAQTMVSLGVSLDGFTAFGSLRDALRDALAHGQAPLDGGGLGGRAPLLPGARS